MRNSERFFIMSEFSFAPAPQPVISIARSTQLFPVRRVYCIGRNYADHAVEMGHDPKTSPPFFFQKNPNNVAETGGFIYPSHSNDVHHEIEMIVALHSGGTNIDVSQADTHIFGYSIGLDMTRRDLQAEMKRLGRPWEVSKAVEGSAPTSQLHLREETGLINSGRIELRVNGEIKQESDLSMMIWTVSEQISILSEYYELAAGDIIMTGTPAGVGPVQKGDVMHGSIEGLGELTVTVD
jgi:fumarylpyruvate hydrolase